MDTNRICPSCQKPLAPDVPMGLCPECLIKSGFPTGVETKSASQAAFVPPAVEEIARLFPQLEILELIGKGGMGAVYKARQKRLDRLVALKILPPGIGGDPAFAERFTREAKALAKLNHPGIVTLYEFGETSGQFYFLMEYVDGVNLRQLLATSRVSTREALAIVPQICDALQFAHDQGIVHRDIKPENILLDRRGRVKVADFGLAKLIGNENEIIPGGSTVDSPTLTESGKIMGTPQYMSPEQIKAPGEVDHRADIYALGVVFYQMLTGELPGKTIAPPSTKVQIDVRLDEVVLRALEKKPELRYQQVSEVKTMVETIVATPDASRRRGNESKTEKAESGNRKALSPVRHGVITGSFVFALVMVLTIGITLILPESYCGTSKVIVRTTSASKDDFYQLQNAVYLVQSSDFLERVAASLNLQERWGKKYFNGINLKTSEAMEILKGRLSARLFNNTSVMMISCYSDSAIESAEIANCVGDTFCAYPPGNRGAILEHATTPLWPVKPNRGLNIIIGILIGAVLAVISGLSAGLFSKWRAVKKISSRREEAQTDKSAIPNPQSAIESRFSRTAIVGVCCLGLALGLVFPGVYAVTQHDRLKAANQAFKMASEQLHKVEQLENGHPGRFQSSGLPSVPNVPAWVEMVFASFPFLEIALLLAAIILGWMAVSQIRRSAGRLYGMGLAVFDGLFIPLLVMDWLFAGIVFSGPETSTMLQPLAILLTLLVIGIVDWFIIRAVWRAVNCTNQKSKWPNWPLVVVMILLVVPALILVGIKAVSSKQKDEMRAASLTSADFHYRVFEADAALVDKLIPAGQRKNGVSPTAKFSSQGVGEGGDVKSAGNFSVATSGYAFTYSQVAEISPDTLQALLSSIGEKPGVLADQTREVSGVWWPNGIGATWLYTRPDAAGFSSGNGGISLAYRHSNGQDEIRIEGAVHQTGNLSLPGGNTDFHAKFLYEGNAPQNSALAFLVPFFQKDNSAHYLVVVYEIGNMVYTADAPAAAPNPASGPVIVKTIPSALLAEPPKLQFLAWQDEWQTNRAGAARHPDGSPVTDATEMKWLHDNDTVRMADFSRWNLLPKPRFLDLWFSHPLIDQNTYIEPVLLDARNKVLPCNMPASSISGDAGNQGLGWCQYVLNLNLEPTNLPPHVTVQLHFSIAGPLENLHDIQVQPSSSPLVIISQTNWVVLSIGQDVYGKAFITVGVDGSSMWDRRVGVMAVLKDGRELAASGGGTSYTADKINPQTFTVNEPVADVAKFIIGTRPIRTVEWKDVVLPPN